MPNSHNTPSEKSTKAVTTTGDFHCMYCFNNDLTKSHSETVHTGDAESYEGYEDWFCCHICRDAGEPCETFFKIPFPEKEAADTPARIEPAGSY